jgi:ribosomal protein L11 methyltransferase
VCDASPIEVCDDDWARRSQQNLEPVTVGRITIVAEADPKSIHNPKSPIQNVEIVIPASMAFGTGHHATTRLCLAALQEIGVTGKSVLDVGTGSGVLAIAAERLGAARAIGIDSDPDAVESARSNLACNPGIARVSFELADLASTSLAQADVVTANLTGALLARSAPLLLAATRPGGSLVLSGLMRHERDDVCAAFGAAAVVWERREEEWVGLVMKKP